MEPAEGRGSASLYGKGVLGFGGGGVWVITMPYHVSGYVGVSGVWIRVRKPEGERDVGRHRIL